MRLAADVAAPLQVVDDLPGGLLGHPEVWTLTAGSLEITWDGGRTEKVTEGQTMVLPPDVLRRIHAPEAFEAYVAMRADGVASVPGTEGTRVLPWAQ